MFNTYLTCVDHSATLLSPTQPLFQTSSRLPQRSTLLTLPAKPGVYLFELSWKKWVTTAGTVNTAGKQVLMLPQTTCRANSKESPKPMFSPFPPYWPRSTTIDLCLALLPRARFRKHKDAVKLHPLLDLRGNIPTFIHISDGKVGDVKVLDLIAFEAGSFYVNPPDNSNCRKEIPKNFAHSRINENPGCW